MMGTNADLPKWFTNFLIKSLDLAAHQLAEALHKAIIKFFKKRTVYSGFKDNIWGADLTDMQ